VAIVELTHQGSPARDSSWGRSARTPGRSADTTITRANAPFGVRNLRAQKGVFAGREGAGEENDRASIEQLYDSLSMRILIVAWSWPPIGRIGALRPLGLAREWSAQGHEVHVITGPGDRGGEYAPDLEVRTNSSGAEVHRAPAPGLVPTVSATGV